jgi:hypothetical protein
MPAFIIATVVVTGVAAWLWRLISEDWVGGLLCERGTP